MRRVAYISGTPSVPQSFIALKDSQEIYSSADATTWNLEATPAPNVNCTFVWTGVEWLAAAFSSGIYASTDLSAWALRHASASTGTSFIKNGNAIICGAAGGVLRSGDNGLTWTYIAIAGMPAFLQSAVLCYNSGTFVIGWGASPARLVYSTDDGLSWTTMLYGDGPQQAYGSIQGIDGNATGWVSAGGGGVYMEIGYKIGALEGVWVMPYYSSGPSLFMPYSLMKSGSRFIMTGDNDGVAPYIGVYEAYSDDNGQTWTFIAGPGYEAQKILLASNGTHFTAPPNGFGSNRPKISSDGLTWTTCAALPSTNWRAIGVK